MLDYPRVVRSDPKTDKEKRNVAWFPNMCSAATTRPQKRDVVVYAALLGKKTLKTA